MSVNYASGIYTLQVVVPAKDETMVNTGKYFLVFDEWRLGMGVGRRGLTRLRHKASLHKQ